MHSLSIGHGPNTRVLDPEVEALLDREFADQCAAAEGLSDGTAYRLERVVPRREALELVLAEERYRTHSALKGVHGHPSVRSEHLDRVLVPDALVITSDHHVVLVRTPKPVGVELQLVGGTATPGQQVLETGADLASFVRQRVGRALPTAIGRIEVGDVLGVVEHHVGCVNLVVAVHVGLVARGLVAAGGAEVVAVPLDQLPAYLRHAPGYLPAVADLL